METTLASASPDELSAVLTLLEQSSLPIEGVREHFREFLVARQGIRVVGAVGLERYDGSALLRSLVVAPDLRGTGLGIALTDQILERARHGGVTRVFLLTQTAADFFRRFGFRTVPRASSDAAIQQSVEFRTACPQSAVCMELDLQPAAHGTPAIGGDRCAENRIAGGSSRKG